jgi:hypothetical protein
MNYIQNLADRVENLPACTIHPTTGCLDMFGIAIILVTCIGIVTYAIYKFLKQNHSPQQMVPSMAPPTEPTDVASEVRKMTVRQKVCTTYLLFGTIFLGSLFTKTLGTGTGLDYFVLACIIWFLGIIPTYALSPNRSAVGTFNTLLNILITATLAFATLSTWISFSFPSIDLVQIISKILINR